VSQDRDKWRAVMNTIMNLLVTWSIEKCLSGWYLTSQEELGCMELMESFYSVLRLITSIFNTCEHRALSSHLHQRLIAQHLSAKCPSEIHFGVTFNSGCFLSMFHAPVCLAVPFSSLQRRAPFPWKCQWFSGKACWLGRGRIEPSEGQWPEERPVCDMVSAIRGIGASMWGVCK
jgi:hypothetical protein